MVFSVTHYQAREDILDAWKYVARTLNDDLRQAASKVGGATVAVDTSRIITDGGSAGGTSTLFLVSVFHLGGSRACELTRSYSPVDRYANAKPQRSGPKSASTAASRHHLLLSPRQRRHAPLQPVQGGVSPGYAREGRRYLDVRKADL